MGFFDFLKRKEERTEEPVVEAKPVRIGLESVEERMGEEISGRLSQEREKARELYAKIRANFREIKRISKELEEKKFEEGERLYSAVNMIKNNYVNRVFGLLGGVPVVEKMEHEELKDFCSKVSGVLENMKKVPPKQAVMLSKYFRKEASRIVKILKDIEGDVKEMKDLLSEGRSIPFLNRIRSEVNILKEKRRRFGDLKREEEVLREKIEKLRSERDEREKDLENLMKSEDYREVIGVREKIEKLKQEKENVMNEIREEFSSVKRPLKKYEHVFKNNPSIPREKRVSFEKLLHSPVKFTLRGEESVLKEIISRVSESLERGEIKLKESELRRFREFSRKVEGGWVSKLKRRYEEIGKEMEEIERRKDAGVLNEREKIRREIEHLEHEISEYERNLENILKGKESAKSEIRRVKGELEKMIERETGKKFIVRIWE